MRPGFDPSDESAEGPGQRLNASGFPAPISIPNHQWI